jgi:photosystem II stability/assembly factor-like uncharacterized protein
LALLVAVVVTLPAPLWAEAFPKVPYVDNLTQGFRIEKHFNTFEFSPVNSDIVYLGTDDGYIYVSEDGGETWDEHDLVNRPEDRSFPLEIREGLHLELRDYADVYDWPQENWQVAKLDSSELLRPLSAPIGIPSDAENFFEYYTSGPVGELFSRHSGLAPELNILDSDLGHAPEVAPKEGDNLVVNWLKAHPMDADKVFAATNDGLFRSEDRGHTWVREYDNPIESRRVVNHLQFSPKDPSLRFMCTSHGLMVTENGGETYSKVEDSILMRLPCYQIKFHPKNPKEIWVGTVFGVWVSRDLGRSFDLIHYTRVPGQIKIRKLAFDPNDAQNILLQSSEIVFLSRDGGESFRRLGFYSFTDQKMQKILFTNQPGELLVATDHDLWKSSDWGENWTSVLFGNVGWLIQTAIFPKGVDGPLWMLSESEVLRLHRRAPIDVDEARLAEIKALIRREPSLSTTLMKTLRVHRVVRSELNEIRQKSRWSHLLPKLHVYGSYRQIDPKFTGRGVFYGAPDEETGELPAAQQTGGRFKDFAFGLMGNWDLSSLIFNKQELPAGADFQRNEEFARELRKSVQLIYSERRRLQIKQIIAQDPDPRAALMREMRIEELTHQINTMTEGWFSAHIGQGVRNVEWR